MDPEFLETMQIQARPLTGFKKCLQLGLFAVI